MSVKSVKVQVKKAGGGSSPLPFYQTELSAGADLYAAEAAVIAPGEWLAVPTGICIALPEGYEAQIRPRSGLAAKFGVTTLNAPGTIDADYRGQIHVLLINHGKEPFRVNPGDRIAQMVLAKYERIEWEETDVLSDTERGSGGFGSTGV